jgi:hypothetical protein
VSGTSAGKLHNIVANGKDYIPKFHMPKFVASQRLNKLTGWYTLKADKLCRR